MLDTQIEFLKQIYKISRMIDYTYFVIRKYDLPDETMKNSICDLLVRGDIMREKKFLNLKNSLNENSISSTCTYYNMTENYSRMDFYYITSCIQ